MTIEYVTKKGNKGSYTPDFLVYFKNQITLVKL